MSSSREGSLLHTNARVLDIHTRYTLLKSQENSFSIIKENIELHTGIVSYEIYFLSCFSLFKYHFEVLVNGVVNNFR